MRAWRERRTYRNVWTLSFALVFITFIGFIGVGVSLASVDRGGWEVALSSLFMAAALWAMSAAGVFPCVRVRRDALVVDNFLFRYVIPWALVKKIDVSDGFEVVVSGWEEPVGSLALSSSLIGAVTGYRTNHRVARAIAEYRRYHADPLSRGEVRRRLHAHPVSFAAWWVFLGVVVPLLELYG